MNKFYEISTEDFSPISFDNNHLFNLYDKVNNFIIKNVGSEYKNILAKPIKHDYTIQWFSSLENLKQHSKNNENDKAVHKYWKFRKKLEEYLDGLSLTDENNRYWVELLRTVFRKEDNQIFYNDKYFTVIWGWKFEDNSIPDAEIGLRIPDEKDENESIDVEEVDNKDDEILNINEEEEKEDEDEVEEEDKDKDKGEEEDVDKDKREVKLIEKIEDDPKEESDEPEELDSTQHKTSFLEFLKYFSGKYWWFLLVLLILIVTVYFFKSLAHG